MEGRCQCGAIRFTTPQAAPQRVYICHCTECRHQSSSSYGITCVFPDFDLEGQAGAAPGAIGIYTRPNATGETRGSFCTRCGSRLVHRNFYPRVSSNDTAAAATDKDLVPLPTVSVKGGCLLGLDRAMLRRAVHIWVAEAIVDIPEGVESWPGEPDGGSFT